MGLNSMKTPVPAAAPKTSPMGRAHFHHCFNALSTSVAEKACDAWAPAAWPLPEALT